MKNKRILGTLCVLLTTICYGLLPAFSFLAFETGVVTGTLLFDKFFYGAIMIWTFLIIKKVPIRLKKEEIIPVLIPCIAYIGVATALYLSYSEISGSLATVISFTYPAMIILIEIIGHRRRVQVLRIAAVVLSLIGLVLIVSDDDLHANVPGVVFALLAAVSYVVYTLSLDSPKLKDVNSLTVTGYLLLSSAVFNFFRCLFAGAPLFTTSADQLFYMILLAVVCVFIAIVCFCLGVRWIGPGNAAIINTFEPAFACLFSWMLVGDPMTGKMTLGTLLIVLAVLIANLRSKSSSL